MPPNDQRETVLYLRLSRDDEGRGESESIQSQRQILRSYAREKGWILGREYVDDGYSGTNFQRPGFRRLLQDVEQGLVARVLVKDLSRLGRNYLLVGQYTELYFPAKGVQVIAVNDGYDSKSQGVDLSPFQNLVNEMVARDSSRKIRSALQARMQAGDFVGAFAPYGYCRSPQNRHRLVVDEQAAPVVRELFARAAQGASPTQLARELTARGIPTPLAHRRQRSPMTGESPGSWSPTTVKKILKNPVYLGHMVQGKSRKISFKSPVTVPREPEEWLVVQNTHPPLVSESLFDQAAHGRGTGTPPLQGEFCNELAGLVFCRDCGRAMSTAPTRRKGAVANLVCGGYKAKGKEACTNHFVDYGQLVQLVFQVLKGELARLSPLREQLCRQVCSALGQASVRSSREPERRAYQKRILELEQTMATLYEDRVQGRITPQRMEALLERYEQEERRCKEELSAFQRMEQQADPLPKLRQEVEALFTCDQLPRELLSVLVEDIQVGQGRYEKEDGALVKYQEIRICLRFQGEKKGEARSVF